MSLLDVCRRTARRTFGIERLRPEQESAMVAILEGHDALVALPTGFGKSLIYQVPAMILERPTIVVSPLIALMADQERALRSRGVPVVVLHSRLRVAERRAALEQLEGSGRLVVLTTPETLESRATAPCFERARPALLCVDEAHCISEWGHDFRPSYLRLGAARKRLGNPVALALTATATPRVRGDIAERLRLRDPVVLIAPAHRENLRLTVEIAPGPAKFGAAGRRIRALRRPGIIYCATTTAVDQLGGALERAGIPVVRYHGRMRAADRAAAQRQFMQPSRRLIMVATSAFGMGIDKPNIRYILHYQAPGSLEQYVQEIGRAGRDGRPAHCILLFDAADLDIQERLQALSRPTVWHLARLETALTAWAGEDRAPTVAALAYSAGVPVRIGEVLLSDLEQAGLVQRDQEGRIIVVAPLENFRAGARDLVAKLKTFRYQSERRLGAVADYAQSEECRSVFLRRYFGEEHPPRCGTCDRCRAIRAAATRAGSSQESPSGKARRTMIGQRDPHTQVHNEKPAGILGDRLRLMFDWYKGMVDESTGRLLYLYDPENDITIGDGEPIRDIAAIWDVEVLSAFLGRDDLRPLIERSLDYFGRLIVERDEYAIVAPRGEQSSIAHSAFLALALSRSEFPDKIQRLAPLIDGILRQQRKDGSYKIFFDAQPDSGEELYPAEAMLSILEAYRLTGDARYLDSVERGFAHYKRAYYDRGRVQPDFLVFFANWQSQAGRLLFEATTKAKVKDLVRAFLFELHDLVIESGFYDRVARQPEAQACVEVACGLEGLADAYAIAALSQDRRMGDYRRCILTALGFLLRAQRMTGCTDRERGGFGGSLAIREQRIDVTGHVASGFIKSVENGIDAPAT